MDPETTRRMAAMMMAGQPGLEHQKLVARTGQWDLNMKFSMAPGAPEMTATAQATIEPIMGGRFLREKVTGTMMDGPFEGEGLTGYDNAAKQYVGTWIDTWSSGIMDLRGSSKDGGRTIEFTGTMTDPMSGKPTTSRLVSSMPDPRSMKLESFVKGEDGKEFRNMEIVYTRKGAAPAAGGRGAPSSGDRAPAPPTRPSQPTTR